MLNSLKSMKVPLVRVEFALLMTLTKTYPHTKKDLCVCTIQLFSKQSNKNGTSSFVEEVDINERVT